MSECEFFHKVPRVHEAPACPYCRTLLVKAFGDVNGAVYVCSYCRKSVEVAEAEEQQSHHQHQYQENHYGGQRIGLIYV